MSGPGKNWRRAATTHCVHGHEYTPENTKWNGDWRECRKCHNMRALARQRRYAEARA